MIPAYTWQQKTRTFLQKLFRRDLPPPEFRTGPVEVIEWCTEHYDVQRNPNFARDVHHWLTEPQLGEDGLFTYAEDALGRNILILAPSTDPLKLTSAFAETQELTEYPPRETPEALRQRFIKGKVSPLRQLGADKFETTFKERCESWNKLPQKQPEDPTMWYEPYLLDIMTLLSCPYGRISARSVISLLQVLLECPYEDNLAFVVPWTHNVLQKHHGSRSWKPRVYLLTSAPYDSNESDYLTDKEVAIILGCSVSDLGGTNIFVLDRGQRKWLVPCWELRSPSIIRWDHQLSIPNGKFILECLRRSDNRVSNRHNPRLNYDKVVDTCKHITDYKAREESEAVEIYWILENDIVSILAKANEALGAWAKDNVTLLLQIMVWDVMYYFRPYLP
jgi:hypothetical protein